MESTSASWLIRLCLWAPVCGLWTLIQSLIKSLESGVWFRFLSLNQSLESESESGVLFRVWSLIHSLESDLESGVWLRAWSLIQSLESGSESGVWSLIQSPAMQIVVNSQHSCPASL